MNLILLALALPLLFALFCSWWVRIGESPQIYQAQTPPTRPGIWFCAHRASRQYSFQHLFIRITPSNPDWAKRHPELFSFTDDQGRAFCTLGAGPKEGKLFLQFNRKQDLRDPVSFEAPVVCEEDAVIASLIQSQQRYRQQLAFNSWPPVTGLGYNCNCMISALARDSGMELPKFSRRFMLCPGISRPVPKEYFEGVGK